MNDSTEKPAETLEHFPPPRDLRCPFDPPPELVRRLKEEPVSRMRIWDGSEPWLVTRYEHGRAVLTDERFSADPRNPGFPEKNVAYAMTLGKDRTIRAIDNPEHDIQKRMMVRDFTVKRVEEIRPYVQTLVDQEIDRMLRVGPVIDLIPGLAVTLPTMVICELLGVPYEEREFFGGRAKAILAAPTASEAQAAGDELNQFIERFIDLKLASPGNDLLSRLVHEQMVPGHLERSVVVSLGRLMLAAGHDTTAGMIGLSTLVLLRDPVAAAQMREATEKKFIVNAVDEMFRYLGTTHAGRRRVAVADVEVGGKLIRAGEGVIVLNNLMDRDESVFPDGAKLDLTRDNARANVAFGYGIHQCPGQLLARMELQVVHSTLWRRMPTLRLAVPPEELRFFEGGSNFEVESLPVTW
ncbi:MAG TPA: cytochrome P450 [Ramlibacter sp.]|nr:cytochrome P450 [Ramlibacter sp.]